MKMQKSLKKTKDFKNVYNNGKSIANRQLVLYYFKNGFNYNRVGISVSKRIGKSHTRNRVKRLIKESYRINQLEFKVGYDLIFIARQGIIGKNYHEIYKSISHLMKKANLIK